ncbi:bacterial Ig family (group 2) protein, partial [Entamoeba invadens IP1]
MCLDIKTKTLDIKKTDFKIHPSILPKIYPSTSIVFKSSDPSIVTVDENGVLTPQRVGKTEIIMTVDSKPIYEAFQVEIFATTGIEIYSETTHVKIGESLRLTAKSIPQKEVISNTAVNWSSLSNNILSISSSGVITALAEGTALIKCVYVESGNTFEATKEFTVYTEVVTTSVVLEVEGLNTSQLVKGTSATAKVYLEPYHRPLTLGVSSVTLTSSNDDILKISQDGTLTGVSEGDAQITVTYTENGNSFKATKTLTVISAPVVLTSIAIETDS